MNTPLSDPQRRRPASPTGRVTFTDSAGKTATLTVNSSMQTVGDVVNAINRLGVGPASHHGEHQRHRRRHPPDRHRRRQRHHDRRRGQLDHGRRLGPDRLQRPAAPGTTINGTMTQTINLAAGDSLQTLVSDINSLNAGVTASIVNDGSSNPYRLSLTSNQSGTGGALVVDASGMGARMSLTESVSPKTPCWPSATPPTPPPASSWSPPPATASPTCCSGATLQVNSATGQPVLADRGQRRHRPGRGRPGHGERLQQLPIAPSRNDTAYDTTSIRRRRPGQRPDRHATRHRSLRPDERTDFRRRLDQLACRNSASASTRTARSAFDSSTLQQPLRANPDAVKQFFTQTGTTRPRHQRVRGPARTT